MNNDDKKIAKCFENVRKDLYEQPCDDDMKAKFI